MSLEDIERKIGAIEAKDIDAILKEAVYIEALGGNEYTREELISWLDGIKAVFQAQLDLSDNERDSAVAEEYSKLSEQEKESVHKGEFEKLDPSLTTKFIAWDLAGGELAVVIAIAEVSEVEL